MSSPAGPSWPTVLGRLAAGLDLDSDSAAWAVAPAMSGEAAPAQVGAFLLGVQAKGPTAREIAAAAAGMRGGSAPVHVPGGALDLAGPTGGMARSHINF